MDNGDKYVQVDVFFQNNFLYIFNYIDSHFDRENTFTEKTNMATKAGELGKN